ncbi:MAG: DUF1934 domain-containing protein [Clostridiales bacterium]|nr:DUF1934 domain-containing protein [Clostridiales bacterium]
MKKKVVINISDKQSPDVGEPETLEMNIFGTLSFSQDAYTLEYTELDGELAGCTTSLCVDDPGRVIMRRSGSYNSELTIERNKRHNCHYDTPYGGFLMGIFGKAVHSSMTPRGGTLKMRYTVDFNSELAAENEMTITVKEYKNNVDIG